METKQTAAEWLESKLNSVKPADFCSIETIKDWVKQAKQMEREQMFEFAEQVLLNTECSFTGLPFMTTGYDNIYNETYGK